MGYQNRAHVFHVVAPPPETPSGKWPLHRTFWMVTAFCAVAWTAIIFAGLWLF